MCICGYSNWAPPRYDPFDGTRGWAPVHLISACVCVFSERQADDMYGSRITMISETQSSCWTRPPGLALSPPITEASWPVPPNHKPLRSKHGFFFFLPVVVPAIRHRGELWCYPTSRRMCRVFSVCMLSIHTFTFTLGTNTHTGEHAPYDGGCFGRIEKQ